MFQGFSDSTDNNGFNMVRWKGCLLSIVSLNILFYGVGKYLIFIGKATPASWHRIHRMTMLQLVFAIVAQTFARPRLRRGFDWLCWSLSKANNSQAAAEPADGHNSIKQLFSALLILTQIMVQFCYLGHYFFIQLEPHPLVFSAFIALGFFLHLIAFLAGFWAIERLSERLWAAKQQTAAPFVLRSELLHTGISVMMALVFTVLGLMVTIRPPVAFQHPINGIPHFPPSLNGLRVAMITDVHIGPTVGRNRVERMVNILNKAKPDVVVIVGDLVDGYAVELRAALEPLKRIRSKHPVLYVTGNHEYYHGLVEDWLSELKNLGIRVLRNSHYTIESNASEAAGSVCFAGVDDVSAHKSGFEGHLMDPLSALSGCQEDSARILLTHQPNSIPTIIKKHPNINVQLYLSGHTHAGQMYVVYPLVYLFNSFVSGPYIRDEYQVYVSPGVNYGGPPLKMIGLSQIPILVLHH